MYIETEITAALTGIKPACIDGEDENRNGATGGLPLFEQSLIAKNIAVPVIGLSNGKIVMVNKEFLVLSGYGKN